MTRPQTVSISETINPTGATEKADRNDPKRCCILAPYARAHGRQPWKGFEGSDGFGRVLQGLPPHPSARSPVAGRTDATTDGAAIKAGRRYVGIERIREYVELSRERLKDAC